MNKFTFLEPAEHGNSKKSKIPDDLKNLHAAPDAQSVNNIIAFSKAYSVRKGKAIEKMEFILN